VPTILLCLVLQDPLEIKDLQGTWKGARFTEGGPGQDVEKGEKLVLVFQGKHLIVRKANNSLVGEADVGLSADGKELDATGTTGGYRNKLYPGRVKLDGDTLLICISGTAGKNAKRPGGFTADPGSAHYLIVATRQR